MFPNLFRKRVDIPLTGRIVHKATSTLCTIEDSRLRRYLAESDGSYKIGETVLVKDGVVIGRTKRVRKGSHFNV